MCLLSPCNDSNVAIVIVTYRSLLSKSPARGTRPQKQKEPEDNQAHQEGVLRWALMHYLLRQYSTSFEDCQVAVLLLYTGVDKL